MNPRQKQLLNLVIENHIETAEPVGSKFLVSGGELNWSEATVRNDLRELEEAGYLTHPHTSAGRIPTEKGYKFYLNSLDFSRARTNKKENDVLGMSLKTAEQEMARKHLAKSLAELSGGTALLALPDQVYFTGLSNLFSQPEFRMLEMVADISQIFDHCEESLESFFDEVKMTPQYFVGKEHNFGNMLSVIAFRFDDSLLVLLGPMRMDYLHNWALMNKAKELL